MAGSVTRAEARLLDAFRRTDFAEFARAAFHVMHPGEELRWNWHLASICHHLEQVRLGNIKRLIIEVPPRSLKSFLVSVAFPAYCLGRDDTCKLITASYALDLSIKLMNDFRALIRSPWYAHLFPNVVAGSTKDTEINFTTARRGYRIATSPTSTITGMGGRLIIIDDPIKAGEALSSTRLQAVQDWYRNTLFSRTNNKKDDAFILVMQRLHIDDLAGYLRSQGGWTILSLPAIAVEPAKIQIGPSSYHLRQVGDVLHPDREPSDVLDDIKRTIGSYAFSAQYQQEPMPVEGELVKWKWFKSFHALPDRDRRIVQSWDIAVKDDQINDYSVCTTWAIIGQDYYLLDVYRGRLLFPELYQQVIALSRKWRADTILIEDKQSGSALIQQLNQARLAGVPRPIAFQPKYDKVSRISSESATIEQGHVFVQEGATWLADLRSELAQFPNGRFDDQVDSVSQFLQWARTHRTPSIGTVRVR